MTESDTPAKVATSAELGPLVKQAGWAVEMHGQCVLFANNAEKERGMSPGAKTRVFTEAQVFAMLAAERARWEDSTSMDCASCEYVAPTRHDQCKGCERTVTVHTNYKRASWA